MDWKCYLRNSEQREVRRKEHSGPFHAGFRHRWLLFPSHLFVSETTYAETAISVRGDRLASLSNEKLPPSKRNEAVLVIFICSSSVSSAISSIAGTAISPSRLFGKATISISISRDLTNECIRAWNAYWKMMQRPFRIYQAPHYAIGMPRDANKTDSESQDGEER